MNASEIDDVVCSRFEGDYIEAQELMHATGVKVTIESVIPPGTEKDSRRKVIDKPMLVIKGSTKNKKMIVGKTNYRILSAIFGKKASAWVGKEIVLACRYLPKSKGFGQENCPCVRVIPPRGTSIPHSAYQFMGSAKPVMPDETRVEAE